MKFNDHQMVALVYERSVYPDKSSRSEPSAVGGGGRGTVADHGGIIKLKTIVKFTFV